MVLHKQFLWFTKPLKAIWDHYRSHRRSVWNLYPEELIDYISSQNFWPHLSIVLECSPFSFPPFKAHIYSLPFSKPNNPTLNWSDSPQNPLPAQCMWSRTIIRIPCFDCPGLNIVSRAQSFQFCNLWILFGLILKL